MTHLRCSPRRCSCRCSDYPPQLSVAGPPVVCPAAQTLPVHMYIYERESSVLQCVAVCCSVLQCVTQMLPAHMHTYEREREKEKERNMYMRIYIYI